jgi:hypothetical protein
VGCTRLCVNGFSIKPLVDPVEEPRQVDIHHNPKPGLDVLLGGEHRILCTPARTEAVAMFAESGIKYRLQHL